MKDKFHLKEGFNIGKTSWVGVGGRCDFLFKPKNELELIEFLTENTGELTILGNTSNVIIGDLGIEGTVIRLASSFMEIKSINDGIVEVGAGMLDKTFATLMAEEEISGFEFLSTIPGNIGGGIKMNCGCFSQEIAENIVLIKGLDFKGKIMEFKANEVKFNYRAAELPENFIITSALLKGVKSNKGDILKKMTENQKKREESQPTGGKTAGSTFKNPTGYKAWKLLQDAGLSELKIGGASFSSKHTNFLINDGTATASSLVELGELARSLVFKKTGIVLEWEIKRMGRF
jgi:UDP-N-acetylmuramate dehydrogenase